MIPRLLTVTGASGSGKSELVHMLSQMTSPWFKPHLVPKFTTRQPRYTDGDEMTCVDSIPKDCDIAYELYGVRYGLRRCDLWEPLMNGLSPIVILNDQQALTDVRDQFSGIARSIFIYRRVSPEIFQELARERGAEDEEEYLRRLQKAADINLLREDYPYLFDWTILNVNGLKLVKAQAKVILESDEPLHIERGAEVLDAPTDRGGQ